MKCLVGTWLADLDQEDREAFKREVVRRTRIDLYALICTAYERPFGLTALKDHLNRRCNCARRSQLKGASFGSISETPEPANCARV